MKKIVLMLAFISTIGYSKCETKVIRLIENAVKIEENQGYLEPEYDGDNIYKTTIFDDNTAILDVLLIDVSTGTVYSVYGFYDINSTEKVKLYQNKNYRCVKK